VKTLAPLIALACPLTPAAEVLLCDAMVVSLLMNAIRSVKIFLFTRIGLYAAGEVALLASVYFFRYSLIIMKSSATLHVQVAETDGLQFAGVVSVVCMVIGLLMKIVLLLRKKYFENIIASIVLVIFIGALTVYAAQCQHMAFIFENNPI
jgi:hypothetical protein